MRVRTFSTGPHHRVEVGTTSFSVSAARELAAQILAACDEADRRYGASRFVSQPGDLQRVEPEKSDGGF